MKTPIRVFFGKNVIPAALALALSVPAMADGQRQPAGSSASDAFCNGLSDDEAIRRKKEETLAETYKEHKRKQEERNVKKSYKIMDSGVDVVFNFKGGICKDRKSKEGWLLLLSQVNADTPLNQVQAIGSARENIERAESHYEGELQKMEEFLAEFDDQKLDEGFVISEEMIKKFKDEALARGNQAEAGEAETKLKPEVRKGWKEKMPFFVKKIKDEKELIRRKHEELKRLKARLQTSGSNLSMAPQAGN